MVPSGAGPPGPPSRTRSSAPTFHTSLPLPRASLRPASVRAIRTAGCHVDALSHPPRLLGSKIFCEPHRPVLNLSLCDSLLFQMSLLVFLTWDLLIPSLLFIIIFLHVHGASARHQPAPKRICPSFSYLAFLGSLLETTSPAPLRALLSADAPFHSVVKSVSVHSVGLLSPPCCGLPSATRQFIGPGRSLPTTITI